MNLVCKCITFNICFILVLYSSCLAYADQANNSITSVSKLSNGSSKEVNHTTRSEANATNQILVPMEGGNIISVQGDKSDKTHSSREGKADPVPSVVEITSEPTNDTQQPPTTSATTPKTLTEPPTALPLNTINKNNSNVSADTSIKPIYEIAQKNDGKKSVAKKEPKFDNGEPSLSVTPNISNNNINQSNINITNTINVTATKNTDTTTKSITVTVATPSTNATAIKKLEEWPKKPLFTEASDDDYAPSNFVSGAKAEASKKKLSDSVPSLESVEKRKSKSADYVVPIVAIILSVPLVTIIMSLMYKRTAEWWHHRHYRRMDFLIEGMYNN